MLLISGAFKVERWALRDEGRERDEAGQREDGAGPSGPWPAHGGLSRGGAPGTEHCPAH